MGDSPCMKPINIVLIRSKAKKYAVKFEAMHRYGPLNFVYLSNAADRSLAHPKTIEVQITPSAE